MIPIIFTLGIKPHQKQELFINLLLFPINLVTEDITEWWPNYVKIIGDSNNNKSADRRPSIVGFVISSSKSISAYNE